MEHIQICIVERDLIVSADMVHTLRSVLPSASCFVYDSVAEARSSMECGGNPQLVVISANADGTFLVSPDDTKWLVNRKVIAFDARNRLSRGGWLYLSKPFTEGELANAVLSLLSGEAGEGGTTHADQSA